MQTATEKRKGDESLRVWRVIKGFPTLPPPLLGHPPRRRRLVNQQKRNPARTPRKRERRKGHPPTRRKVAFRKRAAGSLKVKLDYPPPNKKKTKKKKKKKQKKKTKKTKQTQNTHHPKTHPTTPHTTKNPRTEESGWRGIDALVKQCTCLHLEKNKHRVLHRPENMESPCLPSLNTELRASEKGRE